jgi:hypothetical protein
MLVQINGYPTLKLYTSDGKGGDMSIEEYSGEFVALVRLRVAKKSICTRIN